MATFYKSSRVWVVDFQFDGHPRRWLRALPEGADAGAAAAQLAAELQALHGGRARLQSVRPATDDEDRQYLRGEGPRNAYCPTLVAPDRPAGRGRG